MRRGWFEAARCGVIVLALIAAEAAIRQILPSGGGTARSAHLCDRPRGGAAAREQQHAECDRQPLARRSAAARWRAPRRSRQHRPLRRPAHRLCHEPPRLDRECRVPAARRARQHFDHDGRQNAQPRVRRHRQGGGEDRRRRLVRRRRPHRAGRSAHHQQLRGLARCRRVEPYQHHRHRERRARRPDRDGADRPRHPPAQSGLRGLSGAVQVADTAGHDLRLPGAVTRLRLLAEPAVHCHRPRQ
jgi:hypothetical protein